MIAVGTQLGPYEVLASLGMGGIGEVYRGKDLRLDREVAIKVLPDRLGNSPEALARFERETKAVAALSHPNILAIHDCGKHEDVSFAVMELLEGETLRSRVARSPIPWRKALEIGVAIADGLAAAHSKGIIHRDLKPENIFLTTDGQVKILDFGLAHFQPHYSPTTETQSFRPAQTEPGVLIGTIAYMSPEQARGLPVDARSDIFSLGCVFYEMVGGQRPFHRRTPADTLAAILNQDPPDLGDSGSPTPLELSRLIRHCLEKNPEQRFQSARDLAFDIRAILSDSAITKALPAAYRRRSQFAIWGTVTLLCLVALLAGVLYQRFLVREKVINSLAVLPFSNLGGDPETEYLSDGITESLINNLSQLSNLKVMSRNSVFRYKGKEVDASVAARELGVRAILTGRVSQRGDGLSVSVELVDARDNSHIWGDQFRRKLLDTMSLQDEIATQISEKLRLRLTAEQQRHLTRRYTENAEAYRLYLQGRYHWNKYTENGFRKAMECFNQAIALDPTYALAYVGLADSYYGLSNMYMPPSEAIPKARQAARKALETDETLAEAHVSLAIIKAQYDWDWPNAETEYRRGIVLKPAYAFAHHYYGHFLAANGRLQEAIEELKRALELDPLSLFSNATFAWLHYLARDYDGAIEHGRKTLEMDPNFAVTHYGLGMVYEQKLMFDEAIAEFQKAKSLDPDNPYISALLGHAYAVSGRTGEALAIIEQLKERLREKHFDPFYMAVIYVGLGMREEAFEWLEKAYAARSEDLLLLKTDPHLDPIRSDPRFADLVRRIGLSP
ncbi:MAG: protein kinase [Planctomycetes bacterium]|nr:protein kinase [Planctomycetota bacterium]